MVKARPFEPQASHPRKAFGVTMNHIWIILAGTISLACAVALSTLYYAHSLRKPVEHHLWERRQAARKLNDNRGRYSTGNAMAAFKRHDVWLKQNASSRLLRWACGANFADYGSEEKLALSAIISFDNERALHHNASKLQDSLDFGDAS